ncbi:MAG TPA: cation diffusion facilitator family transporter [Candidatus Deferrimicrobium sp.]|nr:cation diffusion facilitator family transporter [Candidatus Deferrimicrobium sp.]
MMMDGRHHTDTTHHDVSTSIARLFITMTLNLLITVVQVIGGLISGSLSLLSDAVHNFSDAISIIISYIAIRLGKHPSSIRYTFGLKRAEILAAVLNAATLIVICFFLFKAAYERFMSPKTIAGGTMVSVAVIGLIANIVGTLLLKEGSRQNINIRSAYLHLLGDTVSSVAVILGGLSIIFFQIYWIDPLLTVLISIYILRESFEIVKEALDVLMMGVPENISIENIRTQIEEIPNIKNIHHVHVWRLSDKDIHFEAHIDVEEMTVSETCGLGNMIEEKLKHDHGITHVTLQFETDKCKIKKLV